MNTRPPAMPMPDPPIDFNALAANLDEALAALPADDRSAVALRYLVGMSHQEVAVSLGVSADAAKKRVARALARLRQHLAKRGLTSPSDVLENGLTAIAIVHAPPTLIAAISTACNGNASLSVARLSKGVQTALPSTTIKSAAFAVAAVAAALAVGVILSVKALDQSGWMGAKSIALQTAAANASTQPVGKAARNPGPEFLIVGYVPRPGAYSIAGNPTNLLQSVFEAGLERDFNFDTAQLTLIRKIDAKTSVTARYSFHDLWDCKIDPPLLQDGDTVDVAKVPLFGSTNAQPPRLPAFVAAGAQIEPTVVYIGGSVKRAGPYSIKNYPTNAARVIQRAALADKVNVEKTKVTLIRRTGPQSASNTSYSLRDLISGKIDLPLQGGDIIEISMQKQP